MRWIPLLLTAVLLTTPFAVADDDGDDARDRGRSGERGDDDRGEGRGEKGDRVERHRFEKHDDKWLLRNDNISLWFHQGGHSKPALAVFRTGEDGNKSGFKLALETLCEVAPAAARDNASADLADDDEDDEGREGLPFHRVRGHCVNLHPAREWWTSVTNGSGEMTVTMSHLFNQGNVTLVFHVPTGEGKVKFDLLVQDWKWASADNRLVLGLRVRERGAEAHGANATFAGGFVAWASEANATYANGSQAVLPVQGFVKNHDDGARILLLFNGTGGYTGLDYDPTIGIQSGSMTAVPGAGALAVAVAVVAAAAVAARRRR